MNKKEKLVESTVKVLAEQSNEYQDLSSYSYNQIDELQNEILMQKKSIGTSRFHVYQLEGKFIGYDGIEYVALKKVRWGDKTYITLKNFINQYTIYEHNED